MISDDNTKLARWVLSNVAASLLALPIPAPKKKKIKQDDTWLTHGDLFYQAHVATVLSQDLPGCQLISEEGPIPDIPPPQGWFAVLDPLDGTENYTDGRPEWGIGLSLWYDSDHAASALILPSLGAKLVSGDPMPRFDSQILALSAGSTGLAVPNSYRGVRITGSACWNTYHTIRGSFAAFRASQVLRAWDIQAAVCLAVEACCSVRVNGKVYNMRPLDLHCFHSVEISAPQTGST